MSIGPLAHVELDKLARLTHDQDETAVRAWIREHSEHTRRREAGILQLLAILAAAKLSDGESQSYRLELDDNSDHVSTLCGRMITATLNGDTLTVDALIAVWMQLDVEDRVDALTELLLIARTER